MPLKKAGRERPETLAALADLLERWPDNTSLSASQAHDAAAMSKRSGEKPLNPDQRLALKFNNLKRSFAMRRELLQDSLTTKDVAALRGTSRQTPHDRVRSGTLLAVSDNGTLRFPIRQFDANGPDGVVAGLPEVLSALRISDMARIGWLVRANVALNGKSPLAALRAGKREDVLTAARAVGVYNPGSILGVRYWQT